jgi:hypothetical protein
MSIEEVILKILHSNGVISEITAKIDELWHIDCPLPDGREYRSSEDDLFEALVDIRIEYEKFGCKILCQGSRPNVEASGMSRSMGGGRRAFVLTRGTPAKMNQLVDIFDYACPEEVGTVAEQRRVVEEWYGSLPQRK